MITLMITLIPKMGMLVMSLDQYPPSAFTHKQWSELRNTLHELGKPFRGDPNHSNCSLYRIALAMNLCQQYYGELVSVVGHQGGRLIPERICTFILGPPEGKSNLVDRINELQNVPGESFASGAVIDDLHALRQYSNQADHDGTDDLQTHQKADIVDRVYRVVRAVLEWQQNGGGAGNGKGEKGGKGGKGNAGGKAGGKVGGKGGGANLGGKGAAAAGGAGGGAYMDPNRALVHAGLAEAVQQMQQDLAVARARKDYAKCKELQQQVQRLQKLDAQAERLPQELDAAFVRNDFARCEVLEPKIAAVNLEINLFTCGQPYPLKGPFTEGKNGSLGCGVVKALRAEMDAITMSSKGDKSCSGDLILNWDGESSNYTKDLPGSWIQVDLPRGRSLVLTHYALRHGYCEEFYMPTNFLRNWQLQGSNDRKQWEVLRAHTDDESLRETEFAVAHWEVDGITKSYRSFRIFMTGLDSGDFEGQPGDSPWVHGNFLACAGIELFGFLG
jgi:hypothetical protein